MRKSSKEQREEKVKREKALQAELATAIKAPPVMSFSARMPAYTYTSLCLDLKLRKGPACAEARRRKEEVVDA